MNKYKSRESRVEIKTGESEIGLRRINFVFVHWTRKNSKEDSTKVCLATASLENWTVERGKENFSCIFDKLNLIFIQMLGELFKLQFQKK